MIVEPVEYTFGGPTFIIRHWIVASKVLNFLHKNPVAIFSLKDESYVQCLGDPSRLIVEARECKEDGSFTHWVFGLGNPSIEMDVIEGGSVGPVELHRSQVLTIEDARRILKQFLETRTFPDEYHREDVSERFREL